MTSKSSTTDSIRALKRDRDNRRLGIEVVALDEKLVPAGDVLGFGGDIAHFEELGESL